MSSMNPFDPAGHLASLWGKSGDVLLDAQRSLVQELAGWMPSVAPEPAAPDEGYEAARRAFARSWETALDVSRAAAANLSGSGDPALSTTLGHLLDPAAWFARASGRGPRPGDLPEAASLLDAATLVQRRHLEHDVVMVEAWMQAAGAFARALNTAAGQGTAPASPESVTALWSEHADPIFAEAERSDAFRRSRERLAAARADLETAQGAIGQIYGYASRRDLDDLRDTVARLRRHFDEVMIRPDSAGVDASAPAMPAEAVGQVAPIETGQEAADTAPSLSDDAGTIEPMEVSIRAEPPPEIAEPPPRYAVRSHGSDADRPAVLLVGPPGDEAVRDVAASFGPRDMAVREVVWSEAAWRGPLDDLVRDLANVTDDLARDLAPVALLGVGPGAIPLACLAARRDSPALVVVGAAFAFDLAGVDPEDANISDPDWLAAIRRDDALMRGTLTIDGEPADLAAIACPVLALVPGGADRSAEESRALAHLVASDDYADRAFSTPREAGSIAAEWLAGRQPIGPRRGHGALQHEVS